MSASTVSITAANPAARRRPVVSTERKATNIEMLANDVGVSPVTANPGAGGDEKVTSAGNGRDLSHHSIRGEAVLDRSSKDFVQAKKAVGNSTTVQRRTRKVLSKPDKPRWLTVLSIFAKNFVLLVVLLGLVQLIRRLAMKSGESVVGAQPGLVEFEGRIADVESLLKTTAKMIQVQVEVVDRKIENEIGGLKKEMSKKIDDQGAIWESELKKLEAKSEGLEKSLGDLKSVEWLSKEEFQKIYDELKKTKSADLGEASLDEIRTYAREIIEKEIEKHAADGLGRVDYALASGGAMVVKHSEPFIVGRGTNWFLLSAKNGVHTNADKMLKPSFGEPGQCFALKGSTGFVQIKLRTAIIPEAVTLEHVAKTVAYDRSSAPKDCRVSGWLQGQNAESVIETEKMFLLSEFTYNLEKSNAQTFDVSDSSSTGVVDTVRLDFTSNHGSPSHTCIYRFRVHGREPDAVSMMAMQSL
ncbi:SUN domain-containing protein 1 [Neltuma alba]|uniref:SUN domain-containing protein 1 n=1 Tax=Neltuma alba TaxID=207710 RepID=UPI0010A3F8DF|nr:SUN domain-containing protein 1-like [Prosopis alba]XP_028783153.1 SUN domain-containing protein 1-like [Prosopis alba]